MTTRMIRRKNTVQAQKGTQGRQGDNLSGHDVAFAVPVARAVRTAGALEVALRARPSKSAVARACALPIVVARAMPMAGALRTARADLGAPVPVVPSHTFGAGDTTPVALDVVGRAHALARAHRPVAAVAQAVTEPALKPRALSGQREDGAEGRQVGCSGNDTAAKTEKEAAGVWSATATENKQAAPDALQWPRGVGGLTLLKL